MLWGVTAVSGDSGEALTVAFEPSPSLPLGGSRPADSPGNPVMPPSSVLLGSGVPGPPQELMLLGYSEAREKPLASPRGAGQSPLQAWWAEVAVM